MMLSTATENVNPLETVAPADGIVTLYRDLSAADLSNITANKSVTRIAFDRLIHELPLKDRSVADRGMFVMLVDFAQWLACLILE